MAVPSPPIKIDGHCSTIHDGTLYVLSSNGFLSLPLKQHAEWSKERIGVQVAGAACVTVGEGSDAALYVIGGSTKDDSFGGLQRYWFNSGSWETLSTAAPVLQGRTDHSVAYLADTQQILVYAGSQPNAPSFLSSQTFVISTQSPHSIQAYTSMAPPTNQPILQPFNTSHAVMLGGSQLNTQIYTFDPNNGWLPLQTSITAPLSPGAQGNIISGTDGSKVMEVYDATVSPNTVEQIVLMGAYGQTAWTGQQVGSQSSSRKRKRDLTLNSWPKYNGTNAPKVTRSDYSVAQGFRTAVLAGGSNSDSVAIFNQFENSWIDADKFFDSKQVKQQPLKPTKSSGGGAKTASPTSSQSAATTTAGSTAADEAKHNQMLRTLGITLGVLCGIAALFILILLFLRWRKHKKRKQEGYLDEKANDGARMSFADQGASFMKEAGGSVNGLQPPPNKTWNDSNNGSHSSIAIMAGRFGNKRSNSSHEPKASYDSTARLVKDTRVAPVISEPVELVPLDEKGTKKPSLIARTEPKPPLAHYGPTLTAADAIKESSNEQDRRKRSSGWSKYFATSQPSDLSHIPSAYVDNSNKKLSDAPSMYSSDSRTASQPSHLPSSALVPPLDIDFSRTWDGQRLSHVTTGSPSFNDSREDLASRGSAIAPEGQRGLIVDPNRPRSNSETISSYSRSTMSTTTSEFYNDSGATPWTPTSTSFKDHLNSRPPSSVYGFEQQRIPSRGKSGGGGGGFFPGAGTTYRPPPKSSTSTTRQMGRQTGHSSATPSSDWATSPRSTGLRASSNNQAEDRDSNLTVFPRGVPSAYYAGGRDKDQAATKPVNSDLGWLNLGLNGSQTRL